MGIKEVNNKRQKVNLFKRRWTSALFKYGCLLIIFLFILSLFFVSKEIIRVGYGPYYASTPLDLKSMLQERYRKLNNELFGSFFGKKYYTFQVHVQDISDCKDIVERCVLYSKVEDREEDKNKRSYQMISVNTYKWLTASKEEKDSLYIIGYKIAGKDYYTSRFIWHKQIADGNLAKIQSVKQIVDSFPEIPIFLNSNQTSGSTYIVPKIYLMENSLDDLSNISFAMKHDVINEIATKRQAIGVISDSEFTEQLGSLKESLFVQDIMVNIPHDLIVVNKKWWNDLGTDARKHLLEILEKHNMMICSYMAKNGNEKKEPSKSDSISEKQNIRNVMESLFLYYVSMGVKTKNDIYIPDYNLLDITIDNNSNFCAYKTVYGNLSTGYYTFKKMKVNNLYNFTRAEIIHCDSMRGWRIIPECLSGQLDSLIEKRNIMFYKSKK